MVAVFPGRVSAGKVAETQREDCEEALADNEKFPSLCTAPGVGVGHVCFGTAEASVAKAKRARGVRGGQKGSQRPALCRAWKATVRTWASTASHRSGRL